MALLKTAHHKAEDFLNSRGRSPGHVALGAAVCLAAAGVTALIAWKRAPIAANPRLECQFDRLDKSAMEAPKSAYSALWPALFSVMSLSALRVWNAPSAPERTRALTLWGGLQGLNALWMYLGPKQRLAQVAAAVSTLAVTIFYARAAGQVDERSARMVAPYAGWISFDNLLNTELWVRNRPAKASTP